MDLEKLSKELRMILYQTDDCKEISARFEHVLNLYGCQVVINISEDDKVMIIELLPCIQYIKVKKPCKRIYQVIPLDSPLQKGLRRKNTN